MNWEIVSAVGELIGAMAVVVSLLYLAAQIRQGTNSVQGANELELSKDLAAWHQVPIENDKLRFAWNKAAADEEMSDDEITIVTWYVAQWFFLCEGWYRLYKRGLMSDEIWNTRAKAALGLLSIKSLIHWWEVIDLPVAPDFKEYINTIRTSEDPNWAISNVSNFLQTTKAQVRDDGT